MPATAHHLSRGAPTRSVAIGAIAWVTSSALCVAAVAYGARRISGHLAAGSMDPWLQGVAAPACFLLGVSSLALVSSRLARRPPLGRAAAARWAADSAVFGVTAIALLLLAMPSHGDSEWRARVTGLDLAATLFPPLTEELAFRGILAHTVASSLTAAVTSHRVRTVLTIAICSATFSVAHESAPFAAPWFERFAPRFGAGVVLGELAQFSGSLLPPMLAHAAFNALARTC